jgi:hypothetical protein
MDHIIDSLRIKDLEVKGRLAPTVPWINGRDGTPLIIPGEVYEIILDLIEGKIATVPKPI